MKRSRIRRRPVGAVLLALVAAAGCAPSGSHPPNLLLIVSDTLRADVLGCYGGPAAAPHICGLAKQGVLFERAYSASSYTLPSSVTMLTGKHAPVYSRIHRRGENDGERRTYFYIHDEEQLLAERLQARGYDVVLDLENALVGQSNNLQGFRRLPRRAEDQRAAAARLAVESEDPRYQSGLSVASYLLEPRDVPFFVLHWILDPHSSYTPPSHLMRQVRAPPGARLPGPVTHYAELPTEALKEQQDSLSRDEVKMLWRLYVKEVESVDERVGTLLQALDAADLRERTLIFFTSDHGEGFREHGRILHGSSFYDEIARVPLIAAGPGVIRGLRVREPVSHVDLVPTLAELLDVEVPDDVQGSSFAGLLGENGPKPDTERLQYLANGFRITKHDALIDGHHKLISRHGKLELYDLAADPAESKNLAHAEPELLERMRLRLLEIRADNEMRRLDNLTSDDQKVLDRVGKATEEQLRALGYID